MDSIKSAMEYDPREGGEWWKKTPPAADPFFEEELTRLAGVNTFGNPVLRVVWAGTLLSDVAAKPTKKYREIWEGLTHFAFTDEAGNKIKIRDERDAPLDKLVLPVYETIELGHLRWMVEKWQSSEDAVKSGRFDMSLLAEDGSPLFRTPPPEGVYNAFFRVEARDGSYRELDNGVLGAIREMWHYQETNSVEQKARDFTNDRLAAKASGKRRASDRWLNAAVDKEANEIQIEETIKEKEYEIEADRQSRTLIYT